MQSVDRKTLIEMAHAALKCGDACVRMITDVASVHDFYYRAYAGYNYGNALCYLISGILYSSEMDESRIFDIWKNTQEAARLALSELNNNVRERMGKWDAIKILEAGQTFDNCYNKYTRSYLCVVGDDDIYKIREGAIVALHICKALFVPNT